MNMLKSNWIHNQKARNLVIRSNIDNSFENFIPVLLK